MFGVLKYYDLADLSAAADTSSLLVLAPTDSLWKPQGADAAAQAFTFTAKVRGMLDCALDALLLLYTP
jgi:hypothetical protein